MTAPKQKKARTFKSRLVVALIGAAIAYFFYKLDGPGLALTLFFVGVGGAYVANSVVDMARALFRRNP